MTRCSSARGLVLGLLLGAVTTAPRALAQVARPASTAGSTALLQRGAYEEAIAQAERRLEADSTSSTDAVVLVRALTAVGRPAQAVQVSARWQSQPLVAAALAESYEELGRLTDADVAWSVAQRGADSLRARVERLRLQLLRGGVDSALVGLDRLVGQASQSRGSRTASEFRALAIGSRLLGIVDPQRFRDALRYYDRAIALDTSRVDVLVELSDVFLQKFNSADARTSLNKALAINPRHPRALMTLMRLNAVEGRTAVRDPVMQLLAVNPASAAAHTQLAYRLIDAEQYDAAIAQARKGLIVDTTAPAPWVAIAAARWLANDSAGHREALARAHLRLRGSASAEVELADVSARNRLYGDAVRFARAGVARDPRDARAQALLGINLLRTGDIRAGRTTLEAAFARDPFDVRVKNTLDLLDSYANARTVATEHFDLVLEPGDADVMALYASSLAEEAYTALTTRYGYAPSERVRVEFFRSHADFSVRAVGLAGLGALGVAFGNVLAIDLPPARSRGEFNWSAVLWHEFAHTITLGMTGNRVPRWVSEGLSVLEERRARPEWGGGATPMLIAAYSANRLRPVSRLNDGFVHPRYEQEVILSYALSAYVFEMLEERGGIAGIRALLAGYRTGSGTPALMQRIYSLTEPALDSTFDAWFRAKFAGEFAAVRGVIRVDAAGDTITELVGPLREALASAASAAERRQWPDVVRAAKQAVSLFPSFVDKGSGYHFLVAAGLAQDDSAGARGAWTAITARNAEALDENIVLAGFLIAVSDSAAALVALDRAALIDPFDRAVQARLAELAYARRAWATAVRARRAVLALGPSDRADAYYQLARALARAGDTVSAKREVLRALDLAPTFEAAQDLLLSLRASEQKSQ
jgi:cellulose synthase operon protein C